MLMMKGVQLLVNISASPPSGCPLLALFMPLAGRVEQAVLILLVLSLALGTIKGRTVLSAAARRIIHRIQQLSNPFALKQIYPARYYILLCCMMSLGWIRRITGIPDDIGGAIDIAIGSALVHGAIVYYRAMAKTKITCDKVTPDK